MFFIRILSVCFFISSCSAYALEIALSFDDAPRSDTAMFTGKERTQRLLETLAAKDIIEVGFFCNTFAFSESDQQRLYDYGAAGHIIANHTAHHVNLHSPEVTVKHYINDIAEADQKLQVMPHYKRWFRYPYLRQGLFVNADNNKHIERYLEENEYQHGYVTVETYDWHLDTLMNEDIEQGNSIDYESLKEAYLEILWDGIKFYDELAINVLGRSPKHVILLHENDVNALLVAELIDYIREHGGKIIPISEAYNDPIAATEFDSIYLSQSRIRALAKYNNYQGETVSRYEDMEAIEALYNAKKEIRR